MISNIEQLTRGIRKKIQDDWDYKIGISGTPGVGKSVLSIQIAKGIDPTFTLKERLAYEVEEIVPMLDKTPQYGVMIIDEGTKALYKREAMRPESRWVNKVLSVIRAKNKCVIINTPRIGDIDIDVRENSIVGRAHVTHRGRAIWFLKDKTINKGDPWHLEDDKLLRKRTFKGSFVFTDLNKDEKKEYDDIKMFHLDQTMKQAMDFFENRDNGKDEGRIKISQQQLKIGYEFIQSKTKITQREFASAFGLKYHTLTNSLKT